jgi:aminoglycoside 3-N-acetyltransferase I
MMGHLQAMIRQLGPGDTAELTQLLAVFANVFEQPEAYLAAIPRKSYLERLLANPGFIVLVSETDGRMVGGLAAYVLEKFEQERSEVYIYDLGVLEDVRRRGIATLLIQHLQRLAAERGANVIFVQADLEDGPAIALYDSLGLKETVHHFDINVPARMVREER